MKIIKHLIKDSFEAYPLDWDTDYFEVKSARVDLKKIINGTDQKLILDFCNDYEFVTIINKGNINQNNLWIGQNTKAFLADMNVQFIKNIDDIKLKPDKSTEIINSMKENEEILKIASSSFSFSRFFNDPYLNKVKASNIYSHWIESSFNKEKKYFVINKYVSNITGFILFSINQEESYAVIELISVDRKYRGKGIGKILIDNLEMFCFMHDINLIKVGTQVVNSGAIRFYNRIGFNYIGCNSIYHHWSL